MNCPICGEVFPGEAILDRHIHVEHDAVAADIAVIAAELTKRERTERIEREKADRDEAERARIPGVRPEEREALHAAPVTGGLTNADMLDRLVGPL